MHVRTRQTFGMLKAVLSTCQKYQDELNAIPYFNNEVELLAADLQTVSKLLSVLSSGFRGHTAVKLEARKCLLKSFLPVLHSAQAYAAINGGSAMQYTLGLTDTAMSILTEEKLSSNCRRLLNICTGLLPQLEPYRITETQLKSVEQCCNLFDQERMEMAGRRIELKEAKNTTDAAIKHGHDLLVNRLDKLIELVRYSNPDIYSSYKISRQLVHHPTRTLALRLQILEKNTELPMSNVTVLIQRKPETDVKQTQKATNESRTFSRITSQQGACQIKHLPAGSYQATVIKFGYLTATKFFYINQFETTHVLIEMTKLN